MLTRSLTLLCLVPGLALAACGGSSSPTWSELQSVTVTIAQPGLPPPYGRPYTTRFASRSDLARVTAALNAHHIAKVSPTSANGCSGGFTIAIAITSEHSDPVNLSAYRCAHQTYGNVGGDLPGFLSAVGLLAG